jgi:hypothetical protein
MVFRSMYELVLPYNISSVSNSFTGTVSWYFLTFDPTFLGQQIKWCLLSSLYLRSTGEVCCPVPPFRSRPFRCRIQPWKINGLVFSFYITVTVTRISVPFFYPDFFERCSYHTYHIYIPYFSFTLSYLSFHLPFNFFSHFSFHTIGYTYHHFYLS